jgi:hypothetical protein
MRRSVAFLLFISCLRWPPQYDLDVAGPCANPYLPLALGNHWEYQIADAQGAVLGSRTLDVIAVDAQAGRATVRAVETHGDYVGQPTELDFVCVNGAVTPLPPGGGASPGADPAPTTVAAPSVLEQSGSQWTTRSQRSAGNLTAEVAATSQRKSVIATGGYQAVQIDHHVRLALSTGETHDVDAQTFHAPNVGIVRAVGGQRVITLKSFVARSPVGHPPPIARPAARAPRTLASGCVCAEDCLDKFGRGTPCNLCPRCQCDPTACGCPGAAPCPPVCDPNTPPAFCERIGTPGLALNSCPDESAFKAKMIVAELCREGYWDSVIGAFLSLIGVEDANDACGRAGMNDEWEVKGDAEAVGVVAGAGETHECEPDQKINGCDENGPCGAVNRSDHDNCLSHYDRDFELDLALPQDSPALRWLTPLNMGGGNHNSDYVGRDLGIEWEYSFMFPPHTDNPGHALPAIVPVQVEGKKVNLRTPWPGDTLAAHGPVIADCGHMCGSWARDEIHPPTALAWIHPISGKPGYYQLSWRMSSMATFPNQDPRSHPGTLHSVLPLPDHLRGLVQMQTPVCDYLFTDWSYDVLDSCKLLVGAPPFVCNATAMLALPWPASAGLAGFVGYLLQDDGSNFSVACRQQPNARLRPNGGSCSSWHSNFSATITPGDGAVTVSLDSRNDLHPDRPALFGGHADLCVPICPADPNLCTPTNGCGSCPCANGGACSPTGQCCSAGSASICSQPGTACGTPVPGCPGAICQTGVCPDRGTCVNGQCQPCQPKCFGGCGDNGCGGKCKCGSGQICQDDGTCRTPCRPGWKECGGDRCAPPGAQCP